MLVELGAVEQRYRAVLEVLEGASVMDVARRYGVARQTVHAWLRRYAEAGWAGWRIGRRGRRRVRIRCPRRWRRGSWRCGGSIRGGGRAILGWSGRGWCRAGPLVGYRALVRHGLVEARKRRRRREDYRRWERARAMELWQMDVVGRVFLADGTEVKIVTGIDDHSRFVVCAWWLRATARPVCEGLEALRAAWGARADPDR